jgi:hypothetical protein
MDDALQKLKGLNVVALQIINTPKGYVNWFHCPTCVYIAITVMILRTSPLAPLKMRALCSATLALS